MAALRQAARQYSRIYECKRTEPVSADDETFRSRSGLDGTVQLLLTQHFYSVCRKEGGMHSAYEELWVCDTKEAAGLAADVLRLDGHAAVLLTAQQLAI